ERRRVLRPVDVRADGVHRAGISAGDAPDQQASDRPHRSGDPLRDRLPAVAWRDADGHAADEAPLQQRRRRARRRAGSGSRSGAERSPRLDSEGDTAAKIPILLAVLAVLGLLRVVRASLLLWAAAWWVGIYVLLRFGFEAPIPSSVVSIYMGIVTVAILAYISSSQDRRDAVSRPLVRFMTEKRYTALLAATVVAIPALAAANVYVNMHAPLQPPFFSRTVHPASPSEITVHDKKIDLDNGENPFRQLETSNPEEFRKHVEHGRQVYYRNCVFCHGDNLSGNGMYVHGLDPI